MAISFDPETKSYSDGVTTLEIKDGVYEIDSIEKLKLFRDAVNAGNSFSGQTVSLTQSIDLQDEEWTPIGKNGARFAGTFDGNGNTISNLKITKSLSNTADNCGIGFFGYTNSPAKIVDLNIENVDITGSLYVGAIVGYGFTGAEISNCHVSGDVEIEGWWYIGGIGGNGYVSKVVDCTVIGNDGSYIKGIDGSYVGGIWGYRGEGSMAIADSEVVNIDISGVDRVGGICGIAHYGNTIEGCEISLSSITSTVDAGNTGVIAGANLGNANDLAVLLNNKADADTMGSVTIADSLVENPPLLGANDHNGDQGKAAIVGDVTLDENGKITGGSVTVVGSQSSSVNVNDELPMADNTKFYTMSDGTLVADETGYVAEVNGTLYKSLTDAIAVAGDNATITLVDNVTLSSKLNLSQNLTFDLAGFTLSGAVVLSGSADVTFKNGSMTAEYANVTSNEYAVVNVLNSAAMTLDGVTLAGADIVNKSVSIHGIVYQSTGALNVVNSTVAGGNQIHNDSASSGSSDGGKAIYAYGASGGTINIVDSTVQGGYGKTDAVYSGSYKSGLYVGGGIALQLGGTAAVTISGSNIIGGDSDWYNAEDAVNVSNTFKGTLLVKDASTIKGGDALNLSNENRGIGGIGIYTHLSTECTQITVNDSEVIGGDGGRSWNGSAIELNCGTPNVVFNNSSLTVGQGANSSGNAGAIRINTNKVDLTLNGVTMDGAGNGNEVIKVTSVIRDGGIAVAGENTIAGGTLEDVTFVEIADGTTFKTTGTGALDPATIMNSDQTVVFDEETGEYVFEPVEVTTDNVLVNSEWSNLASGTVVSYDGKHYRIGANAFTTVTDAVAATDATNKITVLDGSYTGDQFFEGRTVEIGTADTGAEFSGYVFGGTHNSDSGDISMTFVNGSAGRVYGALFDQEGDYTTGDIYINIGEDVTLTERAGAAKVDKGSVTTGDVIIDFTGTAVPLFGGAQVWYKGSSAVHESVTVNFSGNLSDVIYAAGQAMHGGSIVVNNGVTVNVTGGTIGTDGLMGGGFTRSDIANTDTAGSMTIKGGTWIYISGADTEITDVYGGTHTYSLNGALEAVSTITGGTHIYMSDGEVGNVQGGGYTAWGSTSTIDSTYVSVSGGTVYGDVQGGSYVVGGGKDKDSGNSSTITGGTTIVISGSADIQGSVYGGSWVNWATGTAASYIQGVSSVTVEGGTIAGNVVGGGAIYANSGDGATSTLISESGETMISLTGGTVGGDVYGGAFAADNYRKIGNGISSVEKSSVNVDGAVVKGDIYAGGMAYGNFSTEVESTAAVTVTAGTIEGDIYGGGLGKASVDTATVTIDGTNVTFAGAMNNIYGGGNGSGDGYTVSTNTVGNATVTLTNVDQGDSMVYVYGGGVYGNQNMNSTKVTVTDSNVWAVYGGFNSGVAGSAITGTAEVTVSGSNISGDVYGGTKGFQTTVGGTAVTINDGSVVNGSVYGGGLTGSVDGDVAINISGATVDGSVNLGGGTVTGAASLTISGGNNTIAGGITANGIAGLSTIDIQDGTLIAGLESNGDVEILGNGVFTAGINAKSLQAADGLSFEVTKAELANGALVELTGDAASSISAITVKVTDGDLSSFDTAQIISGNVAGDVDVTLTDGTTTVSVESATENLLVNSEWSALAAGSIVQYGDKYYQIGINAFGNLGDALSGNCNALDATTGTTIKLIGDVSFKETTTEWPDFEYALSNNLNITADNPVVIDITKPLDSGSQNYELILISKDAANPVDVTFGDNVTINTNSKIWLGRDVSPVNYVIDGNIIQTAKDDAQSGVLQIQLCEKSTAILNGSMAGAQYGFQISGGTFTVNASGTLNVGAIAIESGRDDAHDAGAFIVDGSRNVSGAALTINDTNSQRGAGYQASASLLNGAEVTLSGGVTVCDGGTITIDGGSVLNAAGDVKLGNGVPVSAGVALYMYNGSSLTAAGFTADSMVSISLDASSIKADSFDNGGFTMLFNGSSIDTGAVTVKAGSTITMDYTSSIAFDSLDKAGIMSVFTTGYTSGTYKIFDYTGDDSGTVIDYKSLLSSPWNSNYMVVNNDLYLTDQDNSVIYVNSAYTEYDCDGYIYGYNAFSDMNSAIASLTPGYVLGGSFDTPKTIVMTGATSTGLGLYGQNLVITGDLTSSGSWNTALTPNPASDPNYVSNLRLDNAQIQLTGNAALEGVNWGRAAVSYDKEGNIVISQDADIQRGAIIELVNGTRFAAENQINGRGIFFKIDGTSSIYQHGGGNSLVTMASGAIVDGGISTPGTYNENNQIDALWIYFGRGSGEWNGIYGDKTYFTFRNGAYVEAQDRLEFGTGSLLKEMDVEIDASKLASANNIIIGTEDNAGKITSFKLTNNSLLQAGADISIVGTTVALSDSAIAAATITNNGSITVTGNSSISGAMIGGKTYFGNQDVSVDATWNMTGFSNGSMALVNGNLAISGANAYDSTEVITVGGGWASSYADQELGAAAGKLTVTEGSTLYFNQIRIGDRDDNGSVHEIVVDGSLLARDGSGGGVFSRYGSLITVNAGAVFEAGSALSLGGSMNVSGTVNARTNAVLGAKTENSDADWSERSAVLNLNPGAQMSVAEDFEVGFSDDVVRKGVVTVDNAELTVGGTLYVGRNSTQDDYKNGVAEISLVNGAQVAVGSVSINDSSALSLDYTSTLAFTTITNAGTITVDTTGYSGGIYKLFDYVGSDEFTIAEYKTVLGEGNWNDKYIVVDSDLYIADMDMTTLKINAAWSDAALGDNVAEGCYYGFNAFSSMDQVYDVISAGGVSAIELQSDIVMSAPSAPISDMWMKFHDDAVIDSNVSGERRTVSISGVELLLTSTDQSRGNGGEKVTITIGKDVDINTDSSIWFGYYYGTSSPDYAGLYSADIVLDGNINMSGGQAHIVAPGTTMTINETGSLIVAGSDIQTRGADLIVNGTGKDMAQAQVQLNHQNIEGDKSFSIGSDFYYEPSASWTLNNTFVNVNTTFGINTATDSRGSGVDAALNMNNSKLVVGTDFTMDDSASVTLDNGSELIVGGDMALGYRKSVIWGASIEVLNGSTLTVDGTISTKAKSEMLVSNATLNADLDLAGEITFSGDVAYNKNIATANTGKVNIIDGNMTISGGSLSGSGIVNVGDFNDSTAAGSLKIMDGATVDIKGTFYVGTGSETFGANASLLEIDASAGEFKVNNGVYVREDGKVLVNGHSGATFSNINVGGEFEMIGADSVSTGISAGRNTANGGAAKFIMTDSNLVDNAGLEFGYKLNRDVDVTMENSSITVQNGRNAAFGIEANGGYGIANVVMSNSSLAVDGVITIGAGSSVAMDYTSSMKFSGLTSLGTMTVDTTGFTSGTYKIFDYTGDVAGAMDYNELLAGVWNDNYVAVNDDLYITDQDNKTLYVNPDYSEYSCDGYIYGYNAFSSVVDAVAGSGAETAEIVIAEGTYADSGTVVFTNSVNVNANNAAFGNAWSFGINSDDANDFNMDTAAKFVVEGTLNTGAFYTEKNANVYLVLNGDLTTVGSFGAKLATQMDVNGTVTVTPPANGAAQVLVYGTMNVNGTLDSTSGSMNAVMMIGYANYDTQYGKGGVLNVTGADASVTLRNTYNDNTPVIISALSSLNVTDGASFTVERGGIENNGSVTIDNATVTLSTALNNYGTLSVTGTSVIDAALVSSGSVTVDSAMLSASTIANSGNMTITWDSTVKFSEFTNSGTITVDWTDYDTVGRLLLDCVDNSWTVDDYKALLGTAWDDTKFTVTNGDLWLKSTVVYVNTEYGEGLDNDGHLWGINAFADIDSAKAIAPEAIIITGGEITDSAALEGCVGVIQDGTFDGYLYAGNGNLDASGSGDSVLVIEGGTFDRVYGGNRIEADVAVNSGDINLNIADGEFNSVVSGSGHVTSGYARRSGEINVSISGGTFHTTVAGGICHESNEVYDVVYTIGSINFEISGGTFEYHIYGGNVAAKAARSSQTFVDGDINLTIDASQNAVNIIDGCNVVAGSSGYGTVVGNVNVTIKGDKLNFNGIISGGSEGAHYYVGSDGSRTCNSYVEGERSITFSGFNGNFDGRIVVFENISFVDNSNVVFTNTGLSLVDIAEWNFEFGSNVSGVGTNDFTGDAMNLDLTGWDQLSSWDVMDGTGSAFTGWNDLTSVTIGGQAASWDDNLSSWCSADYQLGIREEEGKEVMFVSKLA